MMTKKKKLRPGEYDDWKAEKCAEEIKRRRGFLAGLFKKRKDKNDKNS